MVTASFFFKVRRIFAKLTSLPKSWGMNILVFDMVAWTVEQITTGHGGQSGKFSDLRYEEARNTLTFVVNGKIEEMPIHEISEKTFETMQRPDNWKNLCHGLSIKSPKTLAWLNKRGIYG